MKGREGLTLTLLGGKANLVYAIVLEGYAQPLRPGITCSATLAFHYSTLSEQGN